MDIKVLDYLRAQIKSVLILVSENEQETNEELTKQEKELVKLLEPVKRKIKKKETANG